MIKKLLIAVVIAIVVGLVVFLIGELVKLALPGFGGLLQNFAWLLGLLGGIWYYLTSENVLR